MNRTLSKALQILGVAALMSAPVALVGCGTVRGAGEDLQYAADETAEAFSGGKQDASGNRPD